MRMKELSLSTTVDKEMIAELICAHKNGFPVKLNGLYWHVTGRGEPVSIHGMHGKQQKFTINGGFKSLDEWEQAFKPNLTTKEDAARLLYGDSSKKFFTCLLENKPDVIYIAGAISGDVESNRHKFMAAKHRILASSSKAVILNPAELPVGLTQAQYMSICLPMVMASDTIFMLDGWEKSPGASAEFALAKKLNLKIVHEGEYELSE